MSQSLTSKAPLSIAASHNNKYNNSTNNEISSCNKSFPIDECQWALDYPELQKACFLARICRIQRPIQCQFLNIKGMLQNGPTCGLTAISMMLGGALTTNELLQLAQAKHFTNNGEMFSAKNLYQLISDHLPSLGCILRSHLQHIDTNYQNQIECQLHEGRLNSVKVKDSLLNGACLFVPYPF